MSLILEALRRSERERKLGQPPVLTDVVVPGRMSTQAPQRNFLVFVAAFAVLVAAGAAGYFWWQASDRTAPVTMPIAVAPAPPVKLPDSPPADHLSPLPSPPLPLRGTGQGARAAGEAPEPATPAAPPSAPVLKSAPFTVTSRDPGVRDLAEQTRPAVRPAPAAEPIPARPAATRPRPVATETIRFLRGMSPEFQRGLPEMVVNIHVYSPDAAERILYINNRPYRAGDRVRDDVVVDEIVEDGVVLNQRGQRFKLPRPS